MIWMLLAFAAAPPVDDPLPTGAVARLGTLRWRHGFLINALTVSPDGRTVASAGNGRGLCLWDAVTGELRHHCNTRRFPSAYGIAFSPDGRRVITAESPFLILYDAETGDEVRRFDGHTNGVISAAYSRRGWVASGSHDLTVRIFTADSGALRHELKGFGGVPWGLSVHEKGDRLAVGTLDGTVSVWDARTGRMVWRAAGHIGNTLVAFSGDTLFSGAEDGTLRAWRAEGGPGRILAMGGPKVKGITASARHVAATFADATIRLYDIATGRELRRWSSGAFWQAALAFSPDGRTLYSSGVWRSRVDRWDVETGTAIDPTTGHGGPVDTIAHAGGKWISVGRDREAIVWEGRVGRRVPVPTAAAGLSLLAPSPDGRHLAITHRFETDVRVIDVATGAVRHTLPGGSVRGLAFGRGRVASLTLEAELSVWDTASGRRVLHLTKGLGKPNRAAILTNLAFSPDATRLAVADAAGAVRIVTVADGTVSAPYATGNEVGGITFAPDGRTIAVAGGYGRPFVLLLDAATNDVLRSWMAGGAGVYGVAFSVDGRLLATTGDETNSRVTVWEVRTGEEVVTFAGHHSGAIPGAFSPDGRTLATGAGDSAVMLWNVATPLAAKPEACWEALAGEAGKAHRAAWGLVEQKAADFLATKLTPLKPIGEKELRSILDRLSSDEAAVRDAADRDLVKQGPGAVPALEAVVKGLPAEAKRRVERLLGRWRSATEALREDRAIMALGRMGDAGRPLLKRLAAGAAGAARTEAARRELGE